VQRLYCAPGNGGISEVAELVPIGAEDLEGILKFVKEEAIDLTVVGPEAPLVRGLTDLLEGEGFRVFGPNKAASEIEGSKAFAKEFMRRHGIPTAPFVIFEDPEEAKSWIERSDKPLVVKASGLAAGKGTIVCDSAEEAIQAVDYIMVQRAFGEAGSKIVVEERLEGQELSYIAFCDGEDILPMSTSQDHKRLLDGDKGPNTGGMGAYSPVPFVSAELEKRIIREIMLPAVRGLKQEGRPYKGVLYAGLMIDRDGNPWVLEFNCRFGDPETQPLLVRMQGDILEVMLACIEGRLAELQIGWDPSPAVCVVMASRGYPGPYEKGKEIRGLETLEGMPDVWVFHAGTVKRDNRYLTSGGRVLGVTAKGRDLREAIRKAYEAVSRIHWEGAHYRKDIGHKGLNEAWPS